jgi:large subunit ribosomal protein L33
MLMQAAKKGATILVKLLSTAGTGYFYVKKKNPKNFTQKLAFMKYDPRVRRHVLFTETKLK